ncbi:hypothetical protein AgCh_022536 [Apium graveolens]
MIKASLQILLVGILLAILRPHCAILCEVHAVIPGDFKPMHHSSKMISGYVSATQVKETKIAKRPSAPNPLGNHRPPSTK